MNHYQRARQEALDKYYANPNRCQLCGAVITVAIGQKTKEVRRKKFCGKSCAAIYNNRKNPKRAAQSRPDYIENMTKADLLKFYEGNKTKTKTSIGSHARKVFKNESEECSCRVCKYTKFYDVAHIKPVSEFKDDVLIGNINSLSNLVPLCPNHHRELDSGLLEDSDKERIRRVAGVVKQARLEPDAR